MPALFSVCPAPFNLLPSRKEERNVRRQKKGKLHTLGILEDSRNILYPSCSGKTEIVKPRDETESDEVGLPTVLLGSCCRPPYSGLSSSSLFSDWTLSSRCYRICLPLFHLCLSLPSFLRTLQSQAQKIIFFMRAPRQYSVGFDVSLPKPPKHLAMAPGFHGTMAIGY